MNTVDEDRLRQISELQQDRTKVPWIEAAELLKCKTLDLEVSTDDRLRYDESEEFGSMLDELYMEGQVVFTDDYIDIKVKDDIVLYYTGDEYNWIFRKTK